MNWGPNREEILKLTVAVDKLREQEESFWKQRSRVRWLREGDANTSFFHQSTLQRRRRNKVVKILKDDGVWEENPGRVHHLVDDYFINLFTSSGSREWEQVLGCIRPVVSDDMNQSLLQPISEDEIRVVARQMGGLKAPGPDGFQGVSYHSFWDNIAKEVNELVLFLANGEACPMQLNATHIVLIPKIPNPESVSHFRPISLCNFSYKV